jgi:hypothetical protein
MGALFVALVLTLNGQAYNVQTWHSAGGENLRANMRECSKLAINLKAQGVQVECRVLLEERRS